MQGTILFLWSFSAGAILKQIYDAWVCYKFESTIPSTIPSFATEFKFDDFDFGNAVNWKQI